MMTRIPSSRSWFIGVVGSFVLAGSPGCGDDDKPSDTTDGTVSDADAGETSADTTAPPEDTAPDQADQIDDVDDTTPEDTTPEETADTADTADTEDTADADDAEDTEDTADADDAEDTADTADVDDAEDTTDTTDTVIHLRMQVGFPVLPAHADSDLASALDLLIQPFVGWAERVEAMSGGAIDVELLPCCDVPTNAVHEAVSSGADLDGAQAIAAYLYNTSSRARRTAGLFGGGYTELDSDALLVWMEEGGGQALYDELMQELGYDVVVIPFGSLPAQHLGWFPFELSGPDDLTGLKYRTAGIAAEMSAALGMTPTAAGAGALVSGLSDGTLDGAEFNTPASDLALGLHTATQQEPCDPDGDCRFVYHLGGLGQVAEWFDLVFNRAVYDALTAEQQQILRDAASLEAGALRQRIAEADAAALAILREQVDVVTMPETIVQAQRRAWDEVIDCPADDPTDLFCRVADSLAAFARSVPLVATTTGLSRPESAAAHGDVWYVSNMGEAGPDADGFISKLAADGGVLELQWRSGLVSPRGLRVSADDLLFASDEGGLVVIDPGSTTVAKIDIPGVVFHNDVAIDAAGDVYLSDTGANRVWRIPRGDDDRAAFLARAAAGEVTAVPFFPPDDVLVPDFVGPNGLAVDGDRLVISVLGYTLPVPAGESPPVVAARLFRVPLAGGEHQDTGPLWVEGPDADSEPDVLRGLDGLERLGNECYLGTSNAQGWLVSTCLLGDRSHTSFLADVGVRAADFGLGPSRAIAIPRIDQGVLELRRVPYLGARDCDLSRLPARLAAPIQCCQYDTHMIHKIGIAGDNYERIAHRLGSSLPCRNADGTTGCAGGAPFERCLYGPCGMSLGSAAGDANSVVFIPESSPSECGWHLTDEASEGTYYPEPYDDQELWPGELGTCPYNACLPDGTPVVSAFNVSVTAVNDGAEGTLVSSPPGVDLAAGTPTWAFEGGQVVTLTATPTGADARAVFTGDCAAEGDYGAVATCELTLDASKAVTVTFQCRAEATCLP